MRDDEFRKIATEYLERREYALLTELVSETFKPTVIDSKLTTLTEETIRTLASLLNTATRLLETDEDAAPLVEQLFRALRNAAAARRPVQDWIASNRTILDDAHRFCTMFSTATTPPTVVSCVKLLLQFLNNLVVGNEASSRLVWGLFSGFLSTLITDARYSYFSSALAYNMLYTAVTMLRNNELVLRSIFDAYKDYENNEYLHFLVELFVRNKELNVSYVSYDIEHRLLFLTMLKDLLREKKVDVGPELIKIVSTEFKAKSDCILKTAEGYVERIEPIEVTLLLDVLAIASGDEPHCAQLQEDRSLLLNCLYLLRAVHEVGRRPGSHFSVLSRLSDLTTADGAELTAHPAFGFKAALVRVVANACWRHRGNQGAVRECGGVPLLLDCCRMDARNPYVTQWVVYALRNLCEGNAEVQAEIAATELLGTPLETAGGEPKAETEEGAVRTGPV